jgi:membrane protein DedA with SNARE-associated domain
VTDGEQVTGPEAEPEWWDDPSLPWSQKPTRSDYICLGSMTVAGIYGLVMLPLRPVILGLAPHLLGSLGYRVGLVMVGALAATGDNWWPLVLVVGSLMAMKFDWIFWWAGKLWGRRILDVWAAEKSARTQRRFERAWDWAHRYETLAIVLTYLPIPIPQSVVYAALGAAGTSLKKFLTVSVLAALGSTGIYMLLGHQLGEPAVKVVEAYQQYLYYLSIAILVGMLVIWWWRKRNRTSEESP